MVAIRTFNIEDKLFQGHRFFKCRETCFGRDKTGRFGLVLIKAIFFSHES